jgi:hypothetical protein
VSADVAAEARAAKAKVSKVFHRMHGIQSWQLSQLQAARIISASMAILAELDEIEPPATPAVRELGELLPIDALLAVAPDGREVIALVACPHCSAEHEIRTWGSHGQPVPLCCPTTGLRYLLPSGRDLLKAAGQ